ncbi:hypothetical protein KY348_03080 [Candidatus Woesearchaeota archaeon]|nr:hypothetical protein [Candidatus Woesearchaeota archaeon]
MLKNIYKKEYNIGEILSDAWTIYSKNFKLILLIILCTYLPLTIISEIISLQVPVSADPVLTFNWGLIGIQILIALLMLIVTLAIAFVVKFRAEGEEIDLSKAITNAFSRWFPVIGTSILMGIFLIGLFILLIVPGIIFSVYWIFTIYIVALNNKSGLEALKHSKAIVKGRWWKVVGYGFVFGLIALAVVFPVLAVSAPIILLATMIGKSVILTSVLNIVFGVIAYVISAFFTVVYVVFFLNFDKNRVGNKKPALDTSP